MKLFLKEIITLLDGHEIWSVRYSRCVMVEGNRVFYQDEKRGKVYIENPEWNTLFDEHCKSEGITAHTG